ncbi:hypothetical protein LBYZC6_20060 [Lacrimispora brassicae]
MEEVKETKMRKVDVDEQLRLSNSIKAMYISTPVVLKDRKIVQNVVGIKTKVSMSQILRV